MGARSQQGRGWGSPSGTYIMFWQSFSILRSVTPWTPHASVQTHSGHDPESPAQLTSSWVGCLRPSFGAFCCCCRGFVLFQSYLLQVNFSQKYMRAPVISHVLYKLKKELSLSLYHTDRLYMLICPRALNWAAAWVIYFKNAHPI